MCSQLNFSLSLSLCIFPTCHRRVQSLGEKKVHIDGQVCNRLYTLPRADHSGTRASINQFLLRSPTIVRRNEVFRTLFLSTQIVCTPSPSLALQNNPKDPLTARRCAPGFGAILFRVRTEKPARPPPTLLDSALEVTTPIPTRSHSFPGLPGLALW